VTRVRRRRRRDQYEGYGGPDCLLTIGGHEYFCVWKQRYELPRVEDPLVEHPNRPSVWMRRSVVNRGGVR